ncbi:MAG: cytochrome P450 [Actinomycetota bacterium]
MTEVADASTRGEGRAPVLTTPEAQDDPYPLYRELRAQCPVHRMPENGTYVLLDHADVREAATDPERFSSTRSGRSGAPANARAFNEVLNERGWRKADTLQRTDPPVHTRYRRLLARAFTPKRVGALTPLIDGVVESLLERIGPAGRCEFVSEFALPFPGIVIADQIGLDESRYETFKRWADAMLILAQRPTISEDEARGWAAIEAEAQHHLAELFEQRRAHPEDDLISVLVHAHVHDDDTPLTIEELQDLMHQLVTGGFETTTSALSAGMLLLLQHPDEMQRLREDPTLVDAFVEEVLRFDSPVQGLWRTTTCPVEVGGVEIPQGATVQLRFAAANRDPAVFDDPDRFDLDRANAKEHVAFGMGPHFCIGAALARQEMRSAFTAILARLDDIELDGELPSPLHEPSVFLRPMAALPLRFRMVG